MESKFHVESRFAALFQENDLDAGAIFLDPKIKVWRSLPDRENATLDLLEKNGSAIRFHVKRYPASHQFMAENELNGFSLLQKAQIPIAPVVAHGFRTDGSSFIILQDLAGYTPADKLIAKGFAFDELLNATADLAAKLHDKGLHHRDLYLCHFMVKPGKDGVDAKLIDMARVDRLKSVLTRRRWILKDLGQFWYSTCGLPISDDQRKNWLDRYCAQRDIQVGGLIGPIGRKARAIGRHDARLQKKQPNRNVSIED